MDLFEFLDLQEQALQNSLDLPRQCFKRLEETRKRMSESLTDYEKRVEDFRKKFLISPVSEGEFRARLVILETEYENRCRIAEWGLGAIEKELQKQEAQLSQSVRNLSEEKRQVLSEQKQSGKRKSPAPEKENKKIEEISESFQTELEKKNLRIAELEKMMQQLAQSLDKKNTAYDDLAKRLRSSEESKAEVEARFEQLEKVARKAEMDRERIPPPVPQAQDGSKNNELIEKLKRSESERDAAAALVNRLEGELAQVRSQWRQAEAEKSVAEKAAGETKKGLSEFHAQLKKAETERKTALEAAEETQHLLRESQIHQEELFRRICEVYAAETEKLRSKTAASAPKSFNNKERMELEEQLVELQGSLTNLRNEYENAMTEWRDLSMRQDSARLAEIFQLRTKIRELSKQQDTEEDDPPKKESAKTTKIKR